MPKSRKKKEPAGPVEQILALVLVVAVFGYCKFGCPSPPGSYFGKAETPNKIGYEGRLKPMSGGGAVFAVTSEQAWDSLVTAAVKKDFSSQASALALRGQLFMVDAGTRVRVLDVSGWSGYAKVRILEGKHILKVLYVERSTVE